MWKLVTENCVYVSPGLVSVGGSGVMGIIEIAYFAFLRDCC